MGSVEDKAGLESGEARNAGVQWWKSKSGQGVDGLSMKWRLAEKHSFIYPSGEKKKKNKMKKNAQTRCMTKLLYTVKQGECTPVLLNIPHLLLLNWLIERVGARPLASLSLENWGKRKKKQKQESSPKQRWINLSKRKKKRVNKVQWRLLTEGPKYYFF